MSETAPGYLDAEKALLGSILVDESNQDAVRLRLRPEHFCHPAHVTIFAALCQLQDNHQAIDPVTLGDRLAKLGQLEDVGGPAYLIELLESVPHGHHCEYYAGLVLRDACLRKLHYLGGELRAQASRDGVDPVSVLSEAEDQIHDAIESVTNPQERDIDIRSVLLSVMDRKASAIDRGVASGYAGLDALTQGFQPGNMIILAARPSVGKTAFACNVMRNAAIAGHKVCLFSLEQSKLAIAERLVSIDSQVHATAIKTNDLEPNELDEIIAACNRLGDLPIAITDTPGMTIDHITAQSRVTKRKRGLDLIIIDYLQIMGVRDSDMRLPREQQVASISRGITQLARRLDIPVIVLAQLNRAYEARQDKRPRLSDLRESGSLEQDAHVVCCLDRPCMYDSEQPTTKTNMVVLKNRDGETGTVPLTYLKETLRFTEGEVLSSLSGF